MSRRRSSWPGRTNTLALIKAAAKTGAEIELEDHPNFHFTPRAERPVFNLPPSQKRVDFKRPAHMKGCTNWRPAPLIYGPADYLIPLAGDDHAFTEARRQWAKGNPEPLRQLLSSPAQQLRREPRPHILRQGSRRSHARRAA